MQPAVSGNADPRTYTTRAQDLKALLPRVEDVCEEEYRFADSRPAAHDSRGTSLAVGDSNTEIL